MPNDDPVAAAAAVVAVATPVAVVPERSADEVKKLAEKAAAAKAARNARAALKRKHGAGPIAGSVVAPVGPVGPVRPVRPVGPVPASPAMAVLQLQPEPEPEPEPRGVHMVLPVYTMDTFPQAMLHLKAPLIAHVAAGAKLTCSRPGKQPLVVAVSASASTQASTQADRLAAYYAAVNAVCSFIAEASFYGRSVVLAVGNGQDEVSLDDFVANE